MTCLEIFVPFDICEQRFSNRLGFKTRASRCGRDTWTTSKPIAARHSICGHESNPPISKKRMEARSGQLWVDYPH